MTDCAGVRRTPHQQQARGGLAVPVRPARDSSGVVMWRGDRAVGRPGVAVFASDPITRDGARSYLHAATQVRLLPPGVQAEADVVVMFANEVTEETLAAMRRLAAEAWNPRMRIVLVADRISEPQLRRAVRHGMVGFVRRSQVGMARVLQTVLNSGEARAETSAVLIKSLIDQIGSLPEDDADPQAVDATGLKDREITVLKLLAEGLDTADVAVRLSYSERTIKNILARMMLRLNLRNRAHAIAYATRSGAI